MTVCTVLLIDDDPNVRLPLRLSLERQGYYVFEASSGQEGLELVARHGRAITLVLIDHQMPAMTGIETIRELRRYAPRLPVILMSGLSSDEVEVGSVEPDAFLRKPFELADLTRMVRGLTGADGRATA